MDVVYQQNRPVVVRREFLDDLHAQGMCARQIAEYVLSSFYDRDVEALTLLVDEALGTLGKHQGRADPVKTLQEITRAHDVLDAALQDKGLGILEGASKRDVLLLTCARNTLCWVLGHKGAAEEFVSNLRKVEDRAAELGLELCSNPNSSSARMRELSRQQARKVQ